MPAARGIPYIQKLACKILQSHVLKCLGICEAGNDRQELLCGEGQGKEITKSHIADL